MTPTLTHCLASELALALGDKRLLTVSENVAVNTYDRTAVLQTSSGCIVFPTTTAEVAICVRTAGQRGVPVVVSGLGTGLSGGVPASGHLVVCLASMNRILEVDPRNLTVEVEAGAVTEAVDAAAAPYGLFYPPHPASRLISTIGGNIAENSGGVRGLKYGVTRDYVMGLEVVLANGEVVWLGNKCVKDVAGYNLRDLFIGSEGALGIITRALLRLVPRPAARRTLVAPFVSIEAAGTTASEIIAAKIIPCALEFMDRQASECVEDHMQIGLPRDAQAVLLMATDGHPQVVAEEAAAIEAIANHCGAIEVRSAESESEAARFFEAYRSAFAALARVRPTAILEGIKIPRSELTRMVQSIRETSRKYDVRIGAFGHLGDGNLNPVFLADEGDVDEMHRVESALDELVEHTLSLGGTVTGERVAAIAKKRFGCEQFGDHSYKLLQRIKEALDPARLLNPGTILD